MPTEHELIEAKNTLTSLLNKCDKAILNWKKNLHSIRSWHEG